MGTAAAPVAPANLPLSLSPLVGRDDLLRRARDVFERDGARLVTLTGPGGVGKTRLSLQIALDLAISRQVAPVFVDLAPIADPNLVPAAIALALGLQEGGARSILDLIKTALRESPTLLLLDNCEQVLPAAPIIVDLLQSGSRLTILATSRAPLRLSGEFEIPVPPLELPPADQAASPAELVNFSAVRLFVERARASGAELPLTAETAPAVVAICRRLDGLPLALELAASWTRALSPTALLTRLDPTLPLLTGGPRDHPARLRTMADAIAWSYSLLTDEEQVLFRRLAVFVGGFTLESAEALSRGVEASSRRADGVRATHASPLPDSSSPSVLDSVAALVDHNLVRRDPAGDAEPRFVLLETIREFGIGQLVAHGEAERVRAAHAHHFLTLVETTAPLLKGAEQGRWLDRLEADHGNLRAALGWFAREGELEEALRLAGALIRFWLVRGHLSEGRGWYDRLLAMAADQPIAPSVRARALTGSGTLAQAQRDLDRSTALLEEALTWARPAGDDREIADALNFLGTVANHRGDQESAAAYYTEALPHYQAANHPEGVAGCQNNLALIARERGDYDQATALLEQSLVGFRATGDGRGIAIASNNLGFLATLRGDPATAAVHHRQGLTLFREIGDRIGLAVTLEHVGHLAREAGRPVEAVRLLGAAAALRTAIGSPPRVDILAHVERTLAAARAALDDASFAAAWADGSALSLEAAIEAAWGVVESPAAETAPVEPKAAVSPAGDLTGREIEVLRLLAAGRTDREIGEALFISPSTATRHVANIYRKLDVHSRAAATTFAHRHGLL